MKTCLNIFFGAKQTIYYEVLINYAEKLFKAR